MSTVPQRRHALGMPAGSVRTLLALMVVGLISFILLVPTTAVTPLPPYLIYLLFLILGHFFASHGPAGHTHPLYMPANLVRLGIIGIVAAVIIWKLFHDPQGLKAQFNASVDELKQQPYLPLILLGGFFVGVIVRLVVGRDNPPQYLQDAEAWLSLIAVLVLAIAAIIHGIINPSVAEARSMPNWEGFVAVIIAFYYGERS